MSREEKYFKLFGTCIPVKGKKNATIYDLERGSLEIIPLDLYAIIDKLESKSSIKDLYSIYGKENYKIIEEYLDFLIEKELGFYCDSKEFDFFPKINLDFNIPNEISNCIVEFDTFYEDRLELLITQLDSLGCIALNIITYYPISEIEMNTIFAYLNNTRIKSLEVLTKYDESHNQIFLKNISGAKNRLTKITFFDAPHDSIKSKLKLLYKTVFSSKKISSFKHCGIVSTNYFNVNRNKFLEALNYNSCLYKKISIDINGNIKNCPAMANDFGSIYSTKLESVLEMDDFKKAGLIKKDSIAGCKSCEYRYACTDCRAFLETPSDIFSKPLKCGYDPSTGIWEKWSANPLKKTSINYYGLSLQKRN